MEQDMYLIEQEYLKHVEDCINDELENTKAMLEKIKNQKVTYNDAKKGEQFTKEALMGLYSSRIKRLTQVVSSPYFGRMDFKPNDLQQVQKLYIGKTTVSDENNNLAVIDWRSPISSMYYDSSVGPASYNAPMGIIDGDILLKRQIIIKNAAIESILDTDLVTSDEMLQRYLNIHADKKMKNIVASIQKGQNNIIRMSSDKNIIIQGIAGSGKTSVALHRIAYLIYSLNNRSNKSKVNSNQFLIVGPNNYFLDYISGVLPDLDVDRVSQITISDMLLNILNENVVVQELTDELKEYYINDEIAKDSIIKNSDEFERALNSYIQDIIMYYANTDIVFNGKVIFPKEKMAELLKNINCNYRSNIELIQKNIMREIKDNYDYYYEKLTEDLYREARLLPKDSEKRKAIYEETSLISKNLKTGLAKCIKDHFQLINKKTVLLYAGFIDNIDKYMSFGNIENFKKLTLKRLSKKKITRDDVAPILYLKLLLDDVKDYNNIIHVVIDEAQDLGLLEYKVLRRLIPNASFSIFGDLNQSIFSYRSVNDWQLVKDKVFNGDAEIINMNQSYRTTNEIMNEANKISSYLTGMVSKDIIRHGDPVEYVSCDEDEKLRILIGKLNNLIEKGYESIAIICKTEDVSSKINEQLREKGMILKNISCDDNEYQGGMCTISCGLSKGLEFDATILFDVDSKNYDPMKDIDMKLLYVGMTRALHETIVLSTNDLPFVLKECEKKLVMKKNNI